MARKLVTIRDVAERAGVSVSTVSHVLNGNDQHVGAATRALVREAMLALRYRPNAIARSMVKQKTATVGLVMTEVDNPLFAPVFAGVEEVLRPAGYHIVLVSAPDVEGEVRAIETLRSQQVDGFIFVSLSLCTPNEHLLHLQDDGLPLVLVNRCSDDQALNRVGWADRAVGYAATTHLLDLGHTRIGTISGPISDTPYRESAIERYAGWRLALGERGLSINMEWVINGQYSYKGGFQAVETLLSRARAGGELPSALFIANDAMAIAALKALQHAGLRIPQDIAVVTIGDPPVAAYTIPALTTFALPTHEAGRVAARILLNWLTGEEAPEAQHVILDFSPVVRESCGASRTS
ncbi:MAG: LacI family DNA-binding transcriptional regulator [Ktedonobacteraceae bacterium]